MTNPFKNRAPGLSDPTRDIIPVTPSDTIPLVSIAQALYVETGGSLVIVTVSGATRTVNVSDNAILPVGVAQVMATGTTAGGIHALANS